MPQQQVAKKIGASQKTVSNLENVSRNKGDTIPIKTTNTPNTPNHRGTSKTHTIARLKRDGQKEPKLHNHNNEVERVRQGSDPQYLAARIALQHHPIAVASAPARFLSRIMAAR